MSPSRRRRILYLFAVASTIFQIHSSVKQFENKKAAPSFDLFFDWGSHRQQLDSSNPATTIHSHEYFYVNSSIVEPLHKHPHAGAVDMFGRYGYVHDPTILLHHQQKPLTELQLLLDEEKTDLCAPIGYGPEGGKDLARQFFHDHVQVASPLSEEEAKTIKVFCAIYTHAGNRNQIAAIRQTWGKRCDGFMAASTETNHDTATVHIPHQGPYQGQYKGIWQKEVRSMVAYFHDNFIEDYDYLFLSGDDTYVIMENLKVFLLEKSKEIEVESPYFYTGARTHGIWAKNKKGYDPTFFYMGGGAGYVLSRNTVRSIVQNVFPHCLADTVGSAEDVYMAHCLRNLLNITGLDSRDDQERDRFIQYDPLRRAALPNSADRTFMRFVRLQNTWLAEHHNWTAKYGIQSIAPSVISFHMIQPAVKMRRYDHLLYGAKDETYEKLDCG
ncbi:Fringe-like protein [Nitzschia inconspicua]|uniref:N-acetylgalactosaminide beta-1,3-galactosyltransferase n=1 Tax=Nitzschia inconspicua TaxID=303405 RepID=A0A9K3PAT5_9STRA|nr:Fringe-like protein [Nitzschia inconspicua]